MWILIVKFVANNPSKLDIYYGSVRWHKMCGHSVMVDSKNAKTTSVIYSSCFGPCLTNYQKLTWKCGQ